MHENWEHWNRKETILILLQGLLYGYMQFVACWLRWWWNFYCIKNWTIKCIAKYFQDNSPAHCCTTGLCHQTSFYEYASVLKGKKIHYLVFELKPIVGIFFFLFSTTTLATGGWLNSLLLLKISLFFLELILTASLACLLRASLKIPESGGTIQ